MVMGKEVLPQINFLLYQGGEMIVKRYLPVRLIFSAELPLQI
jgi:hypothetical protein